MSCARRGAAGLVVLLGTTTRPVAAHADDLELAELSLEELMQVTVVSVSLQEEKLGDAPADVTVITAEDLERYQLDSVAEALQLVAGFDVLYDLSTYNVGVRGINAGWAGESNVVKATLDGQDLGFRPTTGVALGPELVPFYAIDRIEVVRGPLSAIYGANAFLGLINVVPRTAEGMGGAGALARATYLDSWGSPGIGGDVAVWATPADVDTFAAVSVRAAGRDGLALPTTSPRYEDLRATGVPLTTTDDDDLTVASYLRLAYGGHRTGTLILDGNLQYVDRSANFNPHSEALHDARLVLANSMARLRYHRELTSRLELVATTSVGWGGPTDAERLYDPYRTEAAYLRRELSYVAYGAGLTLGYRNSARALDVQLGVDYLLDREALPGLVIVDGAGAEVRGPGRDVDLGNPGVFAHVASNRLAPLRLIGGARLETHTLFGEQLSYRAGAIHTLARGTSIKALVGSSFKASPPLLMFGGEHPRLFGVVANDQLTPQYALTTELALSSQPLDQARLGVNAYYTRLRDLVELDTVAAHPRARNRTEITAVGGEVELRLLLARPDLHGFASASYVHTDVTDDRPAGLAVSSQTRLYPAWSASGGLSHTWWRLQTFAVVRWTGERAADNSNLPFLPPDQRAEYFLPSYTLVDCGLSTVGLKLGGRRFRAALRVRNLLGADPVEPGFSGIDVPGLGRQVFLSLEQHL